MTTPGIHEADSGQNLDSTFAALGDPTRRRIVSMLAEQPLTAGEICAAFDISTPATSRHLKILRRAGLVQDGRSEADNRLRVYRLREEPLLALDDWLGDMRRFWRDQLAAFKSHVEAETKRTATTKTKPAATRRRGGGSRS